jgi:hypothetical protein
MLSLNVAVRYHVTCASFGSYYIKGQIFHEAVIATIQSKVYFRLKRKSCASEVSLKDWRFEIFMHYSNPMKFLYQLEYLVSVYNSKKIVLNPYQIK